MLLPRLILYSDGSAAYCFPPVILRAKCEEIVAGRTVVEVVGGPRDCRKSDGCRRRDEEREEQGETVDEEDSAEQL